MELSDAEKRWTDPIHPYQMYYERSAEAVTVAFPEANIHNKVAGQQAASRPISQEIPEQSSYSHHRPSVFSMGSTEGRGPGVLRRRGTTRLGSNIGDSLNEGDEPDTPGACLTRYVERASVPGLAYLYTARTRLAKLAWCGILLFVFGMLTMHLVNLVENYLSWPKQTTVTLGFDTLQFPAVTFCNVNPVKRSRMHLASKEMQELIDHIKPDALKQRMVEQGLMDISRYAKREIHDQVEGTEHEEIVNDGFNMLEDLFAGRQDFSTKKQRNRKRDTENGNKNGEAGISGDGTTELGFLSRENLTSVTADATGIDDNSTSSDSRSTQSLASVSTRVAETTTAATTLGNLIGNFLGRRRKRSALDARRVKRAREFRPPKEITDALDEASENLPLEPGQSGHTSHGDTSDTAVNNTDASTAQAQTTLVYLDTTDGLGVEQTTHPGPGGTTCSQATGFHGQCDTETGVKASSASDTNADNDSLDLTLGYNDTKDEVGITHIKFIDGLDINTTNLRSETEKAVFSNINRFTDRSTTAGIQNQFMYLFTREKRSTRIKMGHALKDMLVDCSFQGGRCYPRDFKILSSPTFGNCYTMDYSDMQVFRSGPENGLSLIMFLETDEYLKGLTSSHGGHIVIHERNTFAFPGSDGLALAAGMEISIALRVTHISRLDQPHGDCDNGDEFFSIYDHVYTRRTCQHFCEHLLIASHCGCYDNEDEEVHRIMELAMQDKAAERPCHTQKDLKCMMETERRYLLRELDCNCKNPCYEVTYSKTISSRQWPTDEFAEVLLQTLCESKSEKECEQYNKIDKRLFSQNFLKVNIFYEDLNYENITEQASYELTQFFSDVGGALGLWMGLSVIAILEVLHFLTSLLRLLASFLGKRVDRVLDREKTGPLKQ